MVFEAVVLVALAVVVTVIDGVADGVVDGFVVPVHFLLQCGSFKILKKREATII